MWQKVIENLSTWLSGGWVSILLGIFGLGGIGIFLKSYLGKMKRKQQLEEINNASIEAGVESNSISEALKANRTYLDKQVDTDRKWIEAQTKPSLEAPSIVKVGVDFVITTKNIPKYTPILLDKKFEVSHVRANGEQVVLLKNAGERTIDVKLPDGTWLSRAITVKE
jgi:hypothetical protein